MAIRSQKTRRKKAILSSLTGFHGSGGGRENVRHRSKRRKRKY